MNVPCFNNYQQFSIIVSSVPFSSFFEGTGGQIVLKQILNMSFGCTSQILTTAAFSCIITMIFLTKKINKNTSSNPDHIQNSPKYQEKNTFLHIFCLNQDSSQVHSLSLVVKSLLNKNIYSPSIFCHVIDLLKKLNHLS